MSKLKNVLMPGTAEQAKLLEKDQGIACHEGWSEKNGICSDISYWGNTWEKRISFEMETVVLVLGNFCYQVIAKFGRAQAQAMRRCVVHKEF